MVPLPPSAGRLTTHVLDTASGRPGNGMRVVLSRLETAGRTELGHFMTNADGRCDEPLLQGGKLTGGLYELVFHVADWRHGAAGFYDIIPIRFRIDDPTAHYHVPLILSPFGYTTYRGS